jgi:hypothetical protein
MPPSHALNETKLIELKSLTKLTDFDTNVTKLKSLTKLSGFGTNYFTYCNAINSRRHSFMLPA